MIKPNFTRRDDGFVTLLKSLKFNDASQNRHLLFQFLAHRYRGKVGLPCVNHHLQRYHPKPLGQS